MDGISVLLAKKKNKIKDKLPIITKNFGHIYRRRVEASSGDINLLIAGAIKDDWNKIIPIINAETM